MQLGKYLTYVFWIAILVSLVSRFVGLGSSALTEGEAELILPAWQLLNSDSPAASSSAVLQNISAFWFFLFGATNFLARVSTAFAGVFIVLSPFLFRKQIGMLRALVLSFLLASSPILLAISRRADSGVIAIGIMILLAWAVVNRKNFWAGFTLGIGIFCGSEFWLYILILGLGLYLNRNQKKVKKMFIELSNWRTFFSASLSGFIVGVFLFGFGFGFNPTWLASVGKSVWELVTSYPVRSLDIFLMKLAAFPLYEPLLFTFILLFLIGNSRSEPKKNEITFWYGLFVFIILLIRQNSILDLAIFVILMAIWASKPLAVWMDTELENPRETGVMGIFVLVVLIFAGLTTLSAFTPGLENTQLLLRMVVAAITILILIISVFLISSGWTGQIAFTGASAGIILLLFTFNTSMMWKAAGLYAQPTFEFWETYDQKIIDHVLIDQINEINNFNLRPAADTQVEIVGIHSAALDWSLRLTNVQHIEDMKLSDLQTPFVITSANVDQNLLLGDFRGQDILWSYKTDFSTFELIDWARWLVYRKPTMPSESIILWTNSNQFVDQQNQ